MLTLINHTSIADIYLLYLNKRHANMREAVGKSAQIVDESMIGKEKIEVIKVVQLEDVNAVPDRRVVDKGFSDTTDLQNEDFIYVY